VTLAVVSIALFVLNMGRAGNRAGWLTECQQSKEKTHEIQRQMLDAVRSRSPDCDALADRLHDLKH